MAARLINGMRVAFHAEDFDWFTKEDFLETHGLSKEEADEARDEISDIFPSTLDE